jgi:hypothetical protein
LFALGLAMALALAFAGCPVGFWGCGFKGCALTGCTGAIPGNGVWLNTGPESNEEELELAVAVVDV